MEGIDWGKPNSLVRLGRQDLTPGDIRIPGNDCEHCAHYGPGTWSGMTCGDVCTPKPMCSITPRRRGFFSKLFAWIRR